MRGSSIAAISTSPSRLYKFRGGKSEQYLKDEHALENYLSTPGSKTPRCGCHSGESARRQRSAPSSSRTPARSANVLRGLHGRYNRQSSNRLRS